MTTSRPSRSRPSSRQGFRASSDCWIRRQSLTNSPPGREAAAVGSAVQVEDLSSGIAREHRLVGDYESREADAVSASSPIGRALIGHVPGDEVEVELPRGRTQRLRVLTVRAAD